MNGLIKKLLFLAIFNLMLASVSFGQNTDGFIDSVRKSLDRLFYAEQYVLDVQVTGFNTGGGGANSLPGLSGVDAASSTILPGLSIGDQNYNYNILLILDSSISSERVRIAQEVLTRQVEARGMLDKVTFKLKQEKILKTLPDELQATTRQIVSGANEGKSGAGAPAAPPAQVASENHEGSKTNIYDFIENKRDLAIRALVVLWTAMASLISLYIIIQRMFGGRQGGDIRASTASAPPVVVNGSENAGSGTKAGGGKRGSKTKEEIYSKDQALFQHIQDVVEQARLDPIKVSKVIERWVQTSENSRYASIFLKNCDIKTIESVCKNLHPTDIERIVSLEIEDFDPFSDENRRVLDEVRGELAKMAASGAIKERPDVFDFLKSVSDEDLVGILAGETLDDVALIATQIPVHRMSTYISALDTEKMQLLMSKISALNSPSLEEIAPLQARLEQKTGNLGEVLVTKTSRVQTLTQMLSNITLAHRQEEAAANLKAQYPDLFSQVRKGVLLASDLENLPVRAAKVFLQSIEGELLGTALAKFPSKLIALRANMPEAVREVFEDFMTREHDNEEMSRSWKKVQDELRELISSGLISGQELTHAKMSALEADLVPEAEELDEVAVDGAA